MERRNKREFKPDDESQPAAYLPRLNDRDREHVAKVQVYARVPTNEENNVGGRKLLYSLSFYRDRNAAETERKLYNAAALGLARETAANAMANFAFQNEISITGITGSGASAEVKARIPNASWMVHLDVKNPGNHEIIARWRKGTVVEIKGEFAKIQDLVLVEDGEIELGPHEAMAAEIGGYCLNHAFNAPNGTPMQLTRFTIVPTATSQDEIWSYYGM